MSINWDNHAEVEAALANEGLALIEPQNDVVHTGVGRAAMVAVSADEQERIDFAADIAEPAIDLDALMQ